MTRRIVSDMIYADVSPSNGGCTTESI
jgi:hypothetical protein